jgi:hypothetical protein
MAFSNLQPRPRSGSGLIFVSLCPRGPGRTEQPFLERDPVSNALAALYAAALTACRALQLARQRFRGDDADMAAGAGDFDHHAEEEKRQRRAMVKKKGRAEAAPADLLSGRRASLFDREHPINRGPADLERSGDLRRADPLGLQFCDLLLLD